MNKAEMADRLAARTGLNKAAARDEVNSVGAVTVTGWCQLRVASSFLL